MSLPEPQSIEDFLSWEPPPLVNILGDGMLFKGGKMILFGRYKSFKSLLTWHILTNIREGKSILGIPTDHNGVSSLYLQAEVPPALFHARVKKNSTPNDNGANRQPLYVWNVLGGVGAKLDSTEGYTAVRNTILKFTSIAPLDLLVIDPLYMFMEGDILMPYYAGRFQLNVDRLITEFGIGVLIVAHPRKAASDKKEDDDRNTDELLGSSTWSGWGDSVIKIRHAGGNNPLGTLIMNRDVVRYAEEELSQIVYKVDRKTLTFSTTILV